MSHHTIFNFLPSLLRFWFRNCGAAVRRRQDRQKRGLRPSLGWHRRVRGVSRCQAPTSLAVLSPYFPQCPQPAPPLPSSPSWRPTAAHRPLVVERRGSNLFLAECGADAACLGELPRPGGRGPAYSAPGNFQDGAQPLG